MLNINVYLDKLLQMLSNGLFNLYSFNLPFIVFIILFLILSILICLEFKIEILNILLIINFILSFYALSAFPGRTFFALNNFTILSIVNLLFLFFYFIRIRNRFYKYLTKPQFFLLIIFLFLFFYSIAIINTKDLFTIEGLTKIILFISSSFLLPSFFCSELLYNKNYLNIFLKSLVYLGIFCAIMGIMTMITDINPYSAKGIATSLFTHPNATGSIYNFTVPPIFYYLFFKKNEINYTERVVFIIGLIISFLSLLFTFSRTSILSILLVIIFFSFYYSRKLFICTMLLIPLAYFIFVSSFISSKGTLTIIARFGLLQTTYTLLQDKTVSFFWGYGTISYKEIFESTKLLLGIGDPNNNPHNIFLFFILQFGFIPFIPLFLFILLVSYKSIMELLKKSPEPLMLLSCSICFPLLIKNMFEDLLIFPEFILFPLFIVFFGFILYYVNYRTKYNYFAHINNPALI